MCKQLKGGNIDIVNINRALYGRGDPDALDLTADQIHKMWKEVWPKIKPKIGKIIITSTPMGIGSCNFKTLWGNSINLKKEKQ